MHDTPFYIRARMHVMKCGFDVKNAVARPLFSLRVCFFA
jgi:hypothetical protein